MVAPFLFIIVFAVDSIRLTLVIGLNYFDSSREDRPMLRCCVDLPFIRSTHPVIS